MFTCVQRKADAMARMSMMISTAEDLVVETGPLVELSLSPNPAMTWRAFIRATSAYLDLTGRAAWKIDAPAGVPVAVWPLMPSRLRPERDRGTGRRLGWKYHDAGGSTEPFTVEGVYYFCDPDFEAGDTLEGLAPRAAVAMAIDQYYKADLANISSLDNGVEPTGALRAPDTLAAKLRRRKIELSDMNRTLRRKLATTLADALDAGETRDQIAERIKGEFNIAHRRAAGIAQNEISASVEEARHEGHKQAGVPLKSGLHCREEIGRPEQRRTEEATTANPIPMDERYTIAGTDATCLHPRGTGRPEQDINCGCTSIARYPGDTIKAVAAHYAHRGFLTYSPAPGADSGGEDAALAELLGKAIEAGRPAP